MSWPARVPSSYSACSAALVLLSLLLVQAAPLPLKAAAYQEPPALASAVAAGTLPPVAQRLPADPLVVALDAAGQAPGRWGGELRTMVSQPKDTRMMVVFGYARLVGYNPQWQLVPDLLAGLDVEEGRIFTLRLRRGHRWSDGAPFTSEDFRFFWEDIVNNKELTPGGPERFLLVDGKPPAEGTVLKQARLAESLEHLARSGFQDCYRGDIAREAIGVATMLALSWNPLRKSKIRAVISSRKKGKLMNVQVAVAPLFEPNGRHGC